MNNWGSIIGDAIKIMIIVGIISKVVEVLGRVLRIRVIIAIFPAVILSIKAMSWFKDINKYIVDIYMFDWKIALYVCSPFILTLIGYVSLISMVVLTFTTPSKVRTFSKTYEHLNGIWTYFYFSYVLSIWCTNVIENGVKSVMAILGNQFVIDNEFDLIMGYKNAMSYKSIAICVVIAGLLFLFTISANKEEEINIAKNVYNYIKNQNKTELTLAELDEMIKINTKDNSWNTEKTGAFIREFLDYMQVRVLEPNQTYYKESL